jgi:hypothetical protein
MTAAARALALALAVTLTLAVTALVSGCSSCGKKNDEPSRDPKFDPTTSDAAPRPDAAAGAKAPSLTPAEQRDLRTRIDPDLCPEAVKRINTLHNRTPTDPVAIDIVSSCLKYGNNAWYRCVLAATTADVVDACGRKFLQPPDEAR